jgi:hypothetical protein
VTQSVAGTTITAAPADEAFSFAVP